MEFIATQITAKNGQTYRLRRAEITDAAALLELLRVTAEETPFLLREPDEVTMTIQQEQEFIRGRMESPGELMLILEREGRPVGLCSLSGLGPFRRYAHRCGISIALCREVWDLGLGRQMLSVLLIAAKTVGYEQVELDVIADNHRAVALYESLGFEKYGVLPRNMKYADGTYADSLWMMKRL